MLRDAEENLAPWVRPEDSTFRYKADDDTPENKTQARKRIYEMMLSWRDENGLLYLVDSSLPGQRESIQYDVILNSMQLFVGMTCIYRTIESKKDRFFFSRLFQQADAKPYNLLMRNVEDRLLLYCFDIRHIEQSDINMQIFIPFIEIIKLMDRGVSSLSPSQMTRTPGSVYVWNKKGLNMGFEKWMFTQKRKQNKFYNDVIEGKR